MIYDFIKTNVEYIVENKIEYKYSFSKDDLLKYIYLDDESSQSRLYNYEGYWEYDKTEEEIEDIIYSSLMEIKNYLYTNKIHFPFYRPYWSDYKNYDDKIEEEKDFIKYRINNVEWEWTKVKYGNSLMSLLSLIGIFMSFDAANVLGILYTILIIFNILIWGQSIRSHMLKIDPLNKKLKDLESIPNDTYSLPNKRDEDDV